MKKLLTIVTLLAFFATQQSISQSLFETSSQDSSQESSQTSSENSSQNSTEGSSQWSTDNTTNSPRTSTEATTDGTQNSEPSAVAFVVVGAVVSIALTVGGILLTVHASQAKEEAVLRLQDQIYLADGKDYREILTFFELVDKDLIEANDKLVAGGFQIDSDQDAADYLAALILELSQKSEKIQYQLSML